MQPRKWRFYSDANLQVFLEWAASRGLPCQMADFTTVVVEDDDPQIREEAEMLGAEDVS